MIRGPGGNGHHSLRRVASPRGHKHAGIADKEVGDIMALAELVHNGSGWIFTHAAASVEVSGVGNNKGPLSPCCL